MITGNIDGVKKFILERLEKLFELKIDKNCIASYELISELNTISNLLKKELNVVIDRRGNITNISIGNINTVKINTTEISANKLSGFRVIHTHLPMNNKTSSIDTSLLLSLKLDAFLSVVTNDNINDCEINMAFCDICDNILTSKIIETQTLEEVLDLNFLEKVSYIEKNILSLNLTDNTKERAILIGTDTLESLKELYNLSLACNIVPLEKIFQKRSTINPTYYIGEGKLNEILTIKQVKNANLIIFDDELSGSQVRNLENVLNCKVIDRTNLILDIFAKRAKTKESMLQVELAMLNHKLPRLRNSNANLDKIKGGVGVKGGIGSRGPGEKKLESDKRHIEQRIEDIKNELSKIVDTRGVQKVKRVKNNISSVAIVGYTNAGKSTLRNQLCKASASNTISKKDVFEADMLFATLDTTIRAITLNDSRKITISDTVGFINKLPHELVEAFKSTLEEVVDADLLLHVVDASNKNVLSQINSVNTVLDELGAKDKNTILVLNKIDNISTENLNKLKETLKDKKLIEVSALNNINLDKLLDIIGEEIPINMSEKEFVIPYDSQHLIPILHKYSNIIKEEFTEDGTYIKTLLNEEIYKKCSNFEI